MNVNRLAEFLRSPTQLRVMAAEHLRRLFQLGVNVIWVQDTGVMRQHKELTQPPKFPSHNSNYRESFCESRAVVATHENEPGSPEVTLTLQATADTVTQVLVQYPRIKPALPYVSASALWRQHHGQRRGL